MAAAFTIPMIVFANVGIDVSLYALILTAAVGFAIGFFPLKRQQDSYDRAWNRELAGLRGTSDAPAPHMRDAPRWLKRDDAESR